MSPGLSVIGGSLVIDGAGALLYGEACCCEDNQEPQACCFYKLPGQPCVVTTPAICIGAGGTPLGPGTVCLPNICAQPTACCFSDRSCATMTPQECADAGGTSQPPGTSCLPNPCIQPRACCFPLTGQCQDLLPADCAAQGGQPQAQGTTCATFVCPSDPCDQCGQLCPPATTATIQLPEYNFPCGGFACTVPACTAVITATACGASGQNIICQVGDCIDGPNVQGGGHWRIVGISCSIGGTVPAGEFRLIANFLCEGGGSPCNEQTFCWRKPGPCPSGVYTWAGFGPGCPGCGSCPDCPPPGSATATFT